MSECRGGTACDQRLFALTHAWRGWCCRRWVPAWWLERRWQDGGCRSGGARAEEGSPCEGRNGWTPSWEGKKRQRFNSRALTGSLCRLDEKRFGSFGREQRCLALWVNLRRPLPLSRLNSYTQRVPYFLSLSCFFFFCSNKDFFKSPFIHQRLKESGVWCCHSDGMAVTPETFLLTTFQTTESVQKAFCTQLLYKVALSISSC